MHFRIEHTVSAPLQAIEDVVVDRQTLFALSAISPIGYRAELVRHRDTGAEVERVARFSAQGLRAMTGLPLAPDKVEWMDRLLWTRAVHQASFAIDPFLTAWLRPRVSCSGEYRLRSSGPEVTQRTVEGDVRVDVPAVGPLFERAIVKLLQRHFAAEAGFLREQVRKPLAAGQGS